MTADRIALLKQDARYIFYHGLTNYQLHAWPEDELRPLTCSPLTRDRANPAHVEVNDVLGNYSLSLIDSLSTLAILASSPKSEHDNHNALEDFQKSVGLVVEYYGDGNSGPSGEGVRARGFDLDSKVQLFETTIRGLGGLLSAHLFAVGDLPIRGYAPQEEDLGNGKHGLRWNVTSASGEPLVYDGQLLRLAYDLGKRLLPAFHTPTGIPYPRINLRTGIPFYENSPLNNDAEHGQCEVTQTPNGQREVTETCSAGAGSLVLEFSVLSRLTGDERFEKLAKKAFWAIWERRSTVDLIGSGIDAETGIWASPYTGVGAGIDSFFEYSFKSHVLLSGLEKAPEDGDQQDVSSSKFLDVWKIAHAALKRHIYRGPEFQHPHYAQNDMWNGAPRYGWVDSLSAYFPGLLTLAGELEEATSTQLLFTALWTRYGAIPERWNTLTGKIDSGLNWWGGRPEFIESNWYLYRATRDPWYLYVGEMAIKDIKRRCWTPCGWAGIQDVISGKLTDRMESFFLGETVKYLYMLFDQDHPLNHLDAPFVFTTEGHPLIIPNAYRPHTVIADADPVPSDAVCPAPPTSVPFTGSAVASRPDIFHAASLVRLHDELLPTRSSSLLENESSSSITSYQASHRIFYPWTLPDDFIPPQGVSSRMAVRKTFDLTFPSAANTIADFGALQRMDNGILIKSTAGLRLSLALEEHEDEADTYRVFALSGFALGREEGIWLHATVLSQLNPTDPHLSQMKDTEAIDLVLDIPVANPTPPAAEATITNDNEFDAQLVSFIMDKGLKLKEQQSPTTIGETLLRALPPVLLSDTTRLADRLGTLVDLSIPGMTLEGPVREAIQSVRKVAQDLREHLMNSPKPPSDVRLDRYHIPAMLAFGPGSAPLPSIVDHMADPSTLPPGALPFHSILYVDHDVCGSPPLPSSIPRSYNVLVVRRGGCSFSEKLNAIPSYPPLDASLKLLIVVGMPDEPDAPVHRPYIHETQVTPAGVQRRNPIPMVLVHAGEDTWNLFGEMASAVAKVVDGEFVITSAEKGARGTKDQKAGLGLKRRVKFACNGVKISNLHAA